MPVDYIDTSAGQRLGGAVGDFGNADNGRMAFQAVVTGLAPASSVAPAVTAPRRWSWWMVAGSVALVALAVRGFRR